MSDLDLLTTSKVCKILGYKSYKSLQRLMRKRAIYYIRLSSGAIRFRPQDVEHYLNQHRMTGKPATRIRAKSRRWPRALGHGRSSTSRRRGPRAR
jgi:predicted site-specific integrase-resolvase